MVKIKNNNKNNDLFIFFKINNSFLNWINNFTNKYYEQEIKILQTTNQ